MIFRDRIEAGRLLAERLGRYRGRDVVVLGLPRGGVPVAAEIACALDAPLDVLVVRKIGIPHQPEVAMGAVGEGGVCVRNDEVIRLAGVSDDQFVAAEMRELGEVERRCQRYRGGRAMTSLAGRTAIIVDDGIATGATALAAVRVARRLHAERVVVATPVSSTDAFGELDRIADEVVTVQTPPDMLAVGYWYDDFAPTPDAEVERLLAERANISAQSNGQLDGLVDVDVHIPLDATGGLDGHLVVPRAAIGVVVFAHGSGSSRNSPRNRFVAAQLRKHRFATLLVDLVPAGSTEPFDVDVLTERLAVVIAWTRAQLPTERLPIGLFGASTGTAVALRVAAQPNSGVQAIVSRGGRPDLAGPRLGQVVAPTLLLVGADDPEVVELNRLAALELGGAHRLVIVPGATHLFEEPGALDVVARDAAIWFEEYLCAATPGG